VVIAVRNEEKNIEVLLQALSSQDYPKQLFEVIIVDDHSTDDTVLNIQQIKNLNFVFKLIHLPEGATSKKKAIAAGIEKASGELIVTTDADCTMPATWLSTYAAFYLSTGAKFIAAPVLMKASESFCRLFQSIDFLILQGITGASVNKKFHAMCNGANLAYPKKVFEEVKGFEGIDNIPSGDDMLLMQKIYIRYPEQVLYLKSKKALVTTSAEPTWKIFFHQRIRWASKAVHYKDARIFYVLLLTYLINAGFLVLAIASFWWYNWFMFLLLFLLAKIIIEFPFVNAVAIYFNMRKMVAYFPFLQPFHIVYVVIAGWLGRFGSYEWKSRTIKTSTAEALKQ
jgi:cellulose synthase/poly-beta-1,6-N-acetylglucosamine synthase-like glycosyltransferase